MQFTIRKAEPDDAAAACAVLHRSISECCLEDHQGNAAVLDAWLGNKTPDTIRSWFSSTKGYAVVAEADGAVVGTAMLGGNNTVNLCYLVPEVRFLGVGKAMLAALEKEALARGLTVLHLGSTKTAHAFYKRNGYIDTGKTESMFGLESRGMRKELIQGPGRPDR